MNFSFANVCEYHFFLLILYPQRVRTYLILSIFNYLNNLISTTYVVNQFINW